jgi:hypothetical protein
MMSIGDDGRRVLLKETKIAKESPFRGFVKRHDARIHERMSCCLRVSIHFLRYRTTLRPLLPSVAIVFVLCILVSSTAIADVQPVTVRVGESKAWVGQRLAFYVELRASGSFSGSASFDLPQLPGVMVMKIGSPVVGSQDLEGNSWFIQTHEFALFSQRAGTLNIPEFPVRFSRRDDFTGPVNDVKGNCPSFKVDIQRPPGSEGVGFLITTESLDVSETWDPMPGDAEVGAMFKRTIVQRTEQLPGMALSPVSPETPEGFRVYVGDAATNDKLQRGEFLGERTETVTYLIQKPGVLVLPELTYVWWNPKTETLESKQLASVTFNVAAPLNTESANETSPGRNWGLGLLLLASTIVVAFQWRRVADGIQNVWRKLNPPDQVAARRLLRACRDNDATAASVAWSVWSNIQGMEFIAERPLAAAVTALQRSIFGSTLVTEWNGEQLATAIGEQQRSKNTRRSQAQDVALPLLNPET